MAPPLYADLSKTANDLFVKDYKDFNPKVEVTTKVLNSTNLKATFTKTDKDGLASVLEFKRKLGLFDCTAKLSGTGERTAILEHSALLPNLKLKGESTFGGATTFSSEYKTADFAGAASYDLKKSLFSLAAVVNKSGLSVGLSSSYNLSSGATDTPSVKVHYNGDGFEVGATAKDLAVAISVDQADADLQLSMGMAFTPDKETSVRGKVDNKGYISALYTQKLSPAVTLKLLGQLHSGKLADGSAHKFGANLVVSS